MAEDPKLAVRDKIVPALLGALITVLIALVVDYKNDLSEHESIPCHGQVCEDVREMKVQIMANNRTLDRIEALIEDLRRGNIRYGPNQGRPNNP